MAVLPQSSGSGIPPFCIHSPGEMPTIQGLSLPPQGHTWPGTQGSSTWLTSQVPRYPSRDSVSSAQREGCCSHLESQLGDMCL